jgi:hypothetical protein
VNTQRRVHPTIAALALPPGVDVASLASPYIAIPDGAWNHGEGFSAVPNLPDTGGWHGDDFGDHVTFAHIHALGSWQSYTWNDGRTPANPVNVLRLGGCIVPPQHTFPSTHPLYGAVSAPYIDQGAFEMFRPVVALGSQQKIVICILTEETTKFPMQFDDAELIWNNVYRGIFSPDGLVRRERAGQNPATVSDFEANTSLDDVKRPNQLSFFRAWNPQLPFWPILAYPVLSVSGRQTTLNEQRHLQVLAAVKVLLQDNGPLNPLYDGSASFEGLIAAQITERVVVVFAGASNGGHQAHWSALRHPQRVHGSFSEVINPSIQRLYGEHDLGHALSRITGGPFIGATVLEGDFLNWNQYLWSFGAECHDVSYPRLFAQGRTYRPAYFGVGDEDITSTGTDWKRLLGGSATSEWGQQGNSTSPIGSPLHNTIGWATAENGCHQTAVAPITNPYTGTPDVYEHEDVAIELMKKAVDQRAAELAQGLVAPPVVVPTHRASTDAEQFYGIDDPHEWHLGRGQDAPAPVPGVLQSDAAFFAAVQPDTAGANPGCREAMLIAERKLFVGSADGYVSAFEVDTSSSLAARQRFVRIGQSVRLGSQAYAMALLSSTRLVVGTRRHLYLLSLTPGTGYLSVVQTARLPWEVSQPHHMRVADVLPSQVNAGKEIVFASIHGGLLFYDENLAPLYEWPEPGIRDFVVDGPGLVTILSMRGVLARVQFVHDATQTPAVATRLVALSRSLPADLRGPVGQSCQGEPIDLELMDFGATGHAPVALWRGDRDSQGIASAVRSYHPTTFVRTGLVNNIPYRAIDIATCSRDPGPTSEEVIGEHLLVLSDASLLSLYSDTGSLIGQKLLTQSQTGYYPFGKGAHTMVVGELVENTPAGNSSSPAYTQEVVIATNTGLMWMHVSELLAPGNLLPASTQGGGTGFALHMGAGATATHAQPRTNQNLSCAWAMARKPLPTGGGFDPYLHVVDQHGCHWKVSRNTSAQWQLELEAVVEPTGGGPRSISYHPFQASAFAPPGPTLGGGRHYRMHLAWRAGCQETWMM